MKNITLLLYFENFLRLISILISVLVASRLYSISEFGKISYLISLVAIANAVAEGGFGQLNLTKYQIFQNLNYPISSLFAVRIVSTLLVIIIFNLITLFLPLSNDEKFLLSLSILISLFGFFILLRQDLINNCKISFLLIAGISSSIITVALKVTAAILQIAPINYVFVSAICICLSGLIYLIPFIKPKLDANKYSHLKNSITNRFKSSFSLLSLNFSIKSLKPFYFASLASVLFTYSDILILKLYTTFDIIAFYSLCQQFCGAVISFSPSIISIYASKEFLKKKFGMLSMSQLPTNCMHKYLRNTLLLSSVVFSLCGLLLLLLINIFILQSNYNYSVYYFSLSIPLILMTFFQQGFCLLLQILKLEKFIYLISFAALSLNIIINFTIIPIIGAVGAIISTTIAIPLSLIIPLLNRPSRSDYLDALSSYSLQW